MYYTKITLLPKRFSGAGAGIVEDRLEFTNILPDDFTLSFPNEKSDHVSAVNGQNVIYPKAGGKDAELTISVLNNDPAAKAIINQESSNNEFTYTINISSTSPGGTTSIYTSANAYLSVLPDINFGATEDSVKIEFKFKCPSMSISR